MRWVWSGVDGDQGSWRGGAGCVLAEQGWVLGDRGPLGDMGWSTGTCPKELGLTQWRGKGSGDQGCGFGSPFNCVGAFRQAPLWAAHFVFLNLHFLI